VGQNDFIMHTDNGGISWQYQNSGYDGYDLVLEKISFVDSLNGWILGNPSGTITYLFSTQDGGKTWNYKKIIPYSFGGYDLYFVNKNDGWLVGHNDYNGAGEIHHTLDGGQTWELNKKKSGYWTYKKVQFLDSLNGWVAGEYFQSELLRTTNGGDSWEIIFNSPYQITDFLFQDKNHGWIILSNVYDYHYAPYHHPTQLFYTSDGGQNWEEFSIPCPNINAISFANLNVGWAVGYNGSILKTTTGGGITSIEDRNANLASNPDNFSLYQNYPNPFNPTTTISYQLPVSSEVELCIYNILGQRVTTLVSTTQPAGNYKLRWDATGLAGGVYFYRLRTDKGYLQTRKMMLLK
jgi:photosystem II stability/assembly factor-like uncharacterized protein